MSHVFVICLVLFEVAVAQQTHLLFNSTDGALSSYFHLVEDDKAITWQNARQKCETRFILGDGRGSLARLQQPHVIGPVMEALERHLSGGDRAWLGATRTSGDEQFYIINSSSIYTRDGLNPENGDCLLVNSLKPDNSTNRDCFQSARRFWCSFRESCDSFNFTGLERPVSSSSTNSCLTLLGDDSAGELTWYEARNYCLHFGGDLRSPLPELGFSFSTGGEYLFWIGALRNPWRWLDPGSGIGMSMTFSSWESGLSARDGEGLDCLMATTMGWQPERCTETKKYYVCEGEEAPDVGGCASSPCANNGVCMISDINKFLCQCVEGYVGVLCEQDLVNEPRVDTMSPTFGPQLGGTNLILTGSHLVAPAQAVYIEGSRQYQCEVIDSTSESIVAITPPCDPQDVGGNFPVYVIHAGGLELPTNQHYEYRGNPEIANIFPLTTIESGGTTVTVQGSSMNAVSAPQMEITLNYTRKVTEQGRPDVNTTLTVQYGPCPTINESQVVCVTPDLDLPEEFDDFQDSSAAADAVARTINYTTSTSELTLTLGFTFDGIQEYRDLRDHPTLSEFSDFAVVRTPRILDPDPEVTEFGKDRPLLIVGRDLDLISPDDYFVTVGQGNCTVLEVTREEIRCLPPQRTPKKRAESSSQNHDIRVMVGRNSIYAYGALFYRPAIWPWIVLGTALAVVLIVVVVVVVVCRRRRRGKQSSPDATTNDRSSQSEQRTGEDIEDRIVLGPIGAEM